VIARVLPPGWMASVCGQRPARKPISLRKLARAGSTSAAAVAAQGSEALRGGRRHAGGVGRAGEIGHEEQVEVGQVVGQVFGGLDQMPR
jgi:hypothetical protein